LISKALMCGTTNEQETHAGPNGRENEKRMQSESGMQSTQI